MTREEAVIILDGFKNNPLFNDTHLQAFNMAISALSENKGDLISRQAVDEGRKRTDKVKLIIEIPKPMYEDIKSKKGGYSNYVHTAIRNGTPLDDVKAEIANLDRHKENYSCVFNRPDLIDLVVDDVLHILDNIGKAESEDI